MLGKTWLFAAVILVIIVAYYILGYMIALTTAIILSFVIGYNVGGWQVRREK